MMQPSIRQTNMLADQIKQYVSKLHGPYLEVEQRFMVQVPFDPMRDLPRQTMVDAIMAQYHQGRRMVEFGGTVDLFGQADVWLVVE